MNTPQISLIIPGYNEADIVAETIHLTDEILKSTHKTYEILIVDDGSKDDTGNILEEIVKSGKYPNFHFVSYKDGPSRRENLAKSFSLLKGELIVVLDMDRSMDSKHIKDFIYWLDQGYEMVIPNRYHKESILKRSLGRYVISVIYNRMIRTLFQTRFQDNICGFKAFKRDVAMRLVDLAGIDKSRTRSVFWDTQIIIYAHSEKINIKVIPVKWTEGKKTSLNFKREIKMFPFIFKFWLFFKFSKSK